MHQTPSAVPGIVLVGNKYVNITLNKQHSGCIFICVVVKKIMMYKLRNMPEITHGSRHHLHLQVRHFSKDKANVEMTEISNDHYGVFSMWLILG